MKCLLPILLALLGSSLCSCVVPVPIPKAETRRTAFFEDFLAKIYYQDGTLYFVDRYDEQQMTLPLSELEKEPYEPNKPSYTVVIVEDKLRKVRSKKDYDGMLPVRFHHNDGAPKFYTLGDERGEDLNYEKNRGEYTTRESKIRRRHLTGDEQFAVFAIPDLIEDVEVEGGYRREYHRDLYLLRSSEELPNGSYSAVFQLKPSYGKKLDVGFPVIGPDVMGGGASIGISPGLLKQ